MRHRGTEIMADGLADAKYLPDLRAANAALEGCLREGAPPAQAATPAAPPPAGPELDLPDTPPALGPPDRKAFHGLFGEIVEALAPHTEADPVAMLAQLIVGFGNLIGRTAYMRIGGDVHHLNLFLVLTGATATGGKGMSWGRCKSVLARVDPDWCENNISTSGVASGEGLIYALRDERFDGEGGVIEAGVKDKRLLVMEPEWGRVMTVAAKDGNITGPVLRNFWDSGDARSLKVEKPYRCSNAHLSIIGHVTAAEIQKRLSAAEKANGGANRIIWLYVRRGKPLPFGGDPWPEELDRLVPQLQYAAQTARRPGEIGLEDEAREAWPPLYTRLTTPLPGTAGEMLARGAPIVRRLAALYALAADRVNVRLADLEAAAALWDYACRSVVHVFGSSTGSPDADHILKRLADAPQGMTRTQIMVDLFQRNVSKERIVAGLTLLRDNRWAHAIRTPTRGGPAERWFAGPAPTN